MIEFGNLSQINNYSLAEAIDDDEGREGDGRSDDNSSCHDIVSEVVGTAAEARMEASDVLDAARGIGLEEGTGEAAMIRCPAEVCATV